MSDTVDNEMKIKFRDAMWNYFGITEDNDLKWYEDIYESVVEPFFAQEKQEAYKKGYIDGGIAKIKKGTNQ